MAEWIWTKDADGDLSYMRNRPGAEVFDLTDDLIKEHIPFGIYIYNGCFPSAWMLEIWGDEQYSQTHADITLRKYTSSGRNGPGKNVSIKCSLDNVIKALHKVDFNKETFDLSLQSFDFNLVDYVSCVTLMNTHDIMFSFDNNEDYMSYMLTL